VECTPRQLYSSWRTRMACVASSEWGGALHALSPKRSTKKTWAFFSRPLIRGGYTTLRSDRT
jgi:hypothetical protein